jgi:hypothetical protein
MRRRYCRAGFGPAHGAAGTGPRFVASFLDDACLPACRMAGGNVRSCVVGRVLVAESERSGWTFDEIGNLHAQVIFALRQRRYTNPGDPRHGPSVEDMNSTGVHRFVGSVRTPPILSDNVEAMVQVSFDQDDSEPHSVLGNPTQHITPC